MVTRYDDVVIDRQQLTISIGLNSYEFRCTNGPNDYIKKGTSIPFEVIAHLLLNGHSTRRQLFDLIYGENPDGGPNCGTKIFDIHFVNWKHIFEKLNVQLKREWHTGQQSLFLKRRK